MIKLIKEGRYTLLETKNETKILILDDIHKFAWINVSNIGEILVTTHKTLRKDCLLSIGKYRLYDVKDEPDLTDLIHLELLVGDGMWQGYLLPLGLPTTTKKRGRIIPTEEIITVSTTSYPQVQL